jgi:hypothetical protein
LFSRLFSISIPDIEIGPNVLLVGAAILAIVLGVWRSAYEWIIGLSVFRERVYVLGAGERARTVSRLCAPARCRDGGCRRRGQGAFSGDLERFAADLRAFAKSKTRIDRVIVAMEDRRGSMPTRELLELRLRGVVIEDASLLMERVTGKLPLDGLNPSTLIFTQGFNVKALQQLVRRLVSIAVSLIGLLICLPLIPFFILAVRLSSPGPYLLPPDSHRTTWAYLFPSLNSARCGRTPKWMALCGPPRTIPVSLRLADSCAPLA